MLKRSVCSIVLAAGTLGAASAASGAVMGVTVADASSGNYTLTSVSVNRSGAGVFTYLPGQLTGVDLTDVDAFDIPLVVQGGASLPAAGTRATLIEDGRLDTGVTNITTIGGTPDRSMEVTFASPVVNSAGEDILLFDLNGDDGIRFWVNNDRAGQGADVAAGSFAGSLITGMPFGSFNYLNGTDTDINSLAELESPTGFTARAPGTGSVSAAGLDLSSVGVPLGASVTSIRLQSLNANRIDPLMIVGLPAVPEPTAAGAGMLVASLLVRRRRRR